MSAQRQITYGQAINEALGIALAQDPSVLVYGLGADDPKGIFGTTAGLHKKFGQDRVFDTPVAENGMTGIGVGAAINGCKVVMTHQRLDFALLSLDQIVNNAAKWHFMFGGQQSVPLTIRMILGQGWGQGPTHSQNLQSWFAHIPGLKVVTPTTAYDAKGLLLSSIFDPNPVIFLEHRWLHNAVGHVPEGDYRVPIGKAHLLMEGKDMTVVSMSHMAIESKVALEHLAKSLGLSFDLIDMRTVSPIDWDLIQASVKKTGRLLAVDPSHEQCSFSSEIVAKIAETEWSTLKGAPQRLAMPNHPCPTSFSLTKEFYVNPRDIAERVLKMIGRNDDGVLKGLERSTPHDIPGEWFKGPF